MSVSTSSRNVVDVNAEKSIESRLNPESAALNDAISAVKEIEPLRLIELTVEVILNPSIAVSIVAVMFSGRLNNPRELVTSNTVPLLVQISMLSNTLLIVSGSTTAESASNLVSTNLQPVPRAVATRNVAADVSQKRTKKNSESPAKLKIK